MREFISDNIVSFFLMFILIAFLPIAKKKVANYIPQKNEKGYYVIMPKTQNIFFGCTFFLLGFLFFAITIRNYIQNDNYFIGLILGVIIISIGFLFIIAIKYNRIEYNDEEIKQYRIYKKEPVIIFWDEIKIGKFRKMDDSLYLTGNDAQRIFVNFSYNGAYKLLEFISQKLTDNSNSQVIENIQKAMDTYKIKKS